jgi:Cu2+-exporting ATPase
MHDVDTVVFYKTGTLTPGELSLNHTETFAELSADQCLRLAASLEQASEHPIARAFRAYPSTRTSDIKNHLGGGLSGEAEGRKLFIGHREFVESQVSSPPPAFEKSGGVEVWLATADRWLARFILDDEVRPDAARAIQALHDNGVRTLLLSGDRSAHVSRVAEQLGIGEAIGQASPEDKLGVLKHLIAEGRSVMMVGDGLNDLPSMAGARVSVAMGGAADLTQLNADAVLLNGHLTELPKAMNTSRHMRRIIRQNMAWALGYNVLALPLAAAGFVPPWLAAIGMSLSSLVVVLNALRLSRQAHSRPHHDNADLQTSEPLQVSL